jgi:hypothetical protein
MDQLRGDKSSLERKLHDAETELKTFSSNHINDENSNFEQTLSNTKRTLHEDDDEALSDTDSDVIEMKQTLNELKHISFHPNEKPAKHSPIIRNNSFERTSNQSLIDSGRWSNTLLSTITNNTYPLGTISKTNSWQFQPSLITREAVLKAARDVLPPGVIDHLTSTH